jgi:hypothetical protein
VVAGCDRGCRAWRFGYSAALRREPRAALGHGAGGDDEQGERRQSAQRHVHTPMMAASDERRGYLREDNADGDRTGRDSVAPASRAGHVRLARHATRFAPGGGGPRAGWGDARAISGGRYGAKDACTGAD